MILNTIHAGVGLRATLQLAFIRNTVRPRYFSVEQAKNDSDREHARRLDSKQKLGLNNIRKVLSDRGGRRYRPPRLSEILPGQVYDPHKIYAATVIGAGPAGIAAVGNLLELGKGPILWVDHDHNGGRLHSHYREVPSNTKVKRFMGYAEGVEAFRKIAETADPPNIYTSMKGMDQEKTCKLYKAANLCRFLAQGLSNIPSVDSVKGRVLEAGLSEKGWKIRVPKQGTVSTAQAWVTSKILVLCTGSKPLYTQLPVTDSKRIFLDHALAPSKLNQKIPRDVVATVGVIGASHSAVLVLRNLYLLASTTHTGLRIKWFTRHLLRYAEEKDGWILRDNTGLKGDAADWARDNLEDDKLPHSDGGKYITKVVTVKDPKGEDFETYKRELTSCNYYVEAIGYEKQRSFQNIVMDETRLRVHDDLVYDHETAEFTDKQGKKIPGLYGAGIAYPEKVVDPEGNVEYAVGLAKFMKYLKRVVPNWNGGPASQAEGERSIEL